MFSLGQLTKACRRIWLTNFWDPKKLNLNLTLKMGTYTIDLNSNHNNNNNNNEFDLSQVLLRAREAFARKITLPVDFRIKQLKSLRACLDENENEFISALKSDLNKPKFETIISEIQFVKNDIKYQVCIVIEL